MFVSSNNKKYSTFFLFFLLFLFTSCSPSIGEDEIEERDGVFFRKGRTQPYTGSVIEKFDNGKKHYENHYKDGTQNGKWLYWDENGEKTSEHIYQNGELLGKWSFNFSYFENGDKERQETYRDNKLDGLLIQWFENGQKEREANYSSGKLDGELITWY